MRKKRNAKIPPYRQLTTIVLFCGAKNVKCELYCIGFEVQLMMLRIFKVETFHSQ